MNDFEANADLIYDMLKQNKVTEALELFLDLACDEAIDGMADLLQAWADWNYRAGVCDATHNSIN